MISCCFMLSVPAFGQTKVTIEKAEIVNNTTVDGERVRKLYDAVLSSGDFRFMSDSAWQFLDKDEVHAFGNIQIDTPTERIWADTLIYYNILELSKLRGRVIIEQDSTLLFGNSVDYNFATKVGHFLDEIRLEDTDGILVADSGIYYQNSDSAEFRGNVQLADSAQYVEGDSLFINRETKFLRLFDNLIVIDSTNNALLTGHYLEADSTGRRYLSDDAYLRSIVTDSTTTEADTTHIFGDEIELTKQDTTSFIDAMGNVRVWSSKFSSLSDTLKYNSTTELFRLYGDPKAWHNNIQLSGPFISVQLKDNNVENLTSYPSPFAVQEDTVTGRLNQIKGDTLSAYFTDGDISKIDIYPNSELLYHTKNDANEPDGAVESSSPKTILYFDKGELVRAWMGQNQGLFLPEYTELSERKLAGFIWTPELRPIKPTREPLPQLPPISADRPFELPLRFVNRTNVERQ